MKGLAVLALTQCPAQACPRNLTGGRWEMQKGQKTEDQPCTKLGPGRLAAQMETHQPSPPPVSLLYTGAKQGGATVLGEGQDTVTGETCIAIL
jgi:hypothetical protein